MAWSTRELAELAGTTLRTVRHYHDVGLMAEPERDVNGYKRYGVADLLRLARIRRLVDLGFTLPQIAGMAEGRPHATADLEDVDELDGQLADRIEQLQRVRRELAGIRERGGRDTLLGDGLSPAAEQALTGPDRDFLLVLARVASPQVLEAYLGMVDSSHGDPVLRELDALDPDADERTRADLARRVAERTRSMRATRPRLRDLTTDSRLGSTAALTALRLAAAELYHPAQLDVVRRAAHLNRPPGAGRGR